VFRADLEGTMIPTIKKVISKLEYDGRCGNEVSELKGVLFIKKVEVLNAKILLLTDHNKHLREVQLFEKPLISSFKFWSADYN
jgi:hypothetical protein